MHATEGERIDIITVSLQSSPYSKALRMSRWGTLRAGRMQTARCELTAAAAVLKVLNPRIVIYENVGTLLQIGWEDEWRHIQQILAGAGRRRRWRYQAIRPERVFREGVRRNRLWMVSWRE